MTLEDWMKETSALIAMGCKGLGLGLKTEKFETTVSVNVVWSEKKTDHVPLYFDSKSDEHQSVLAYTRSKSAKS
jgi:hypothetical protein